MSVKHVKDVPAEPVNTGEMTSMQWLISTKEGPHFAMRRFVMEPGGEIPEHTNTVEHEQYVLQGHAKIGIDGKEFEVQARDAVFIPKGAPHWYKNSGEENFEFLCLIPNQPDEMKLVGNES